MGGKKKKKKKGSSSSSSKKKAPVEAAPADKKAIAKAAALKNKKANEKKAAAAEKKKKTALSLPDDDDQEIDLVAKMEEARRAMPNACVVRASWAVGLFPPCAKHVLRLLFTRVSNKNCCGVDGDSVAFLCGYAPLVFRSPARDSSEVNPSQVFCIFFQHFRPGSVVYLFHTSGLMHLVPRYTPTHGEKYLAANNQC